MRDIIMHDTGFKQNLYRMIFYEPNISWISLLQHGNFFQHLISYSLAFSFGQSALWTLTSSYLIPAAAKIRRDISALPFALKQYNLQLGILSSVTNCYSNVVCGKKNSNGVVCQIPHIPAVVLKMMVLIASSWSLFGTHEKSRGVKGPYMTCIYT